jgi:hypothetical protein
MRSGFFGSHTLTMLTIELMREDYGRRLDVCGLKKASKRREKPVIFKAILNDVFVVKSTQTLCAVSRGARVGVSAAACPSSLCSKTRQAP